MRHRSRGSVEVITRIAGVVMPEQSQAAVATCPSAGLSLRGEPAQDKAFGELTLSPDEFASVLGPTFPGVPQGAAALPRIGVDFGALVAPALEGILAGQVVGCCRPHDLGRIEALTLPLEAAVDHPS